ncbi:hypothetical protein IT397_00450 [Candidatus Nomurabacteria bacterium]|nr:hypothetical protein [Candidatus Nomurabacteria bacterium]
MKEKIKLLSKIDFKTLTETMRKIFFRGVYNNEGKKINPYKKVKFRMAKVVPPKGMCETPEIIVDGKTYPLFSPQPTIYLNQIEIVKTVDKFLKKEGMSVNNLKGAVEYHWEGRDTYHMIPPIVEKHTYYLKDGFIDLDKLKERFNSFCVKDAKENLHKISDRYLKDFYIDEVSAIKHLDIFHSNAPIINYGIRYTGKFDFYIVCDGSHRIDYAIEHLNKPIDVILVEGSEKHPIVPYYAFPMPFRPTIRLSSKRSEKMYPRLERDKVHLLNDFLKKVLHYDWTPTNLNISRLRSNTNDIN